MRQIHLAGEKLFVDWAADTIPVFDAATGEEHRAHIAAACLDASGVKHAGRHHPEFELADGAFHAEQGAMPEFG